MTSRSADQVRGHPRRSGTGERDPGRVVAFSDGVIAIAVTLLVLGLRAPSDTTHLPRSLAAMWPAYLSYVITFMLVAQVWANHHVLFDHIRHADRLLLFLNAVLLMDIALIPFAASVLANAFRDGHGERTAVLLHGLAFEVAAGLFNVIWWYARRSRRLLAGTIDAAGVRAITRRFALALAWIGAATVLGALVPLLGVVLFSSFLAYYWLPVSGELGVARPGPRAAEDGRPPAEPDGPGRSTG
ncbi:MAG TPA: TMEM175 family protein [Trebonia sp.]|nr:TMEM175 family protein [Trebonia sp.]